ncbi:TniQ family protein [Planomonospora algeriensis]
MGSRWRRITWPGPARELPIPQRPLPGESINSFLRRLAAVNHIDPGVLLADLAGEILLTDHRWEDSELDLDDQAMTRLAARSGNPLTSLRHALRSIPPRHSKILGGKHGPRWLKWRAGHRPVRACPGCLAMRSTHPHAFVYLDPPRLLCSQHGYWLTTSVHAERPFPLTRLPEVVHAHRHHLRFRRRHRDNADAVVSQARVLINRIHARGNYLHERWDNRASLLGLPRSSAVIAMVTYPEVIALAEFVAPRRLVRPTPEDITAALDELGRRLGEPYPSNPAPSEPLTHWLRQKVTS